MTRTLQFGVLFFSLIGLAGCATNNQVVQKGIFQQRKYVRPGWFVQLPDREDPPALASVGVTSVEPASAPLAELPAPVLEPIEAIDDATLSIGIPEEDLSGSLTTNADNELPAVFAGPVELISKIMRVDLDPAIMSEPPPGPHEGGSVNTMALLGFIFAFLIPILGLVFSIIGLNQTRNGEAGHGLALAGLIISIVLILVYGVLIL